jgi:hypothetical protein
MDLTKSYATNVKAAEEGVWVDLDDKTSLLIRRYGRRAFQKYLASLLGPHKKATQRGTLDDDIAEQLLTKALAKEILVGWKGLKMDGKDVKYSVETAFEILSNPVFRDFRDDVVSWAQDFQLFREEEIADAVEK